MVANPANLSFLSGANGATVSPEGLTLLKSLLTPEQLQTLASTGLSINNKPSPEVMERAQGVAFRAGSTGAEDPRRWTGGADGLGQANRFLQLLQAGVPREEAFALAYPSGVPTPQSAEEKAKDAQKGGLAQAGGMVGGVIAGKYAASQIANLLAGGGAGEAAVAPIGVEMGSALPSLQAPLGFAAETGGVGVGGGAGGGAASAAAGEAGALAPGIGTAAGVAGVIAVPLLAKMIGDIAFPDKLGRPFVASEAANSKLLGRQIEGYSDLPQEGREAIATRLHDLKALGATGIGAAENGALVSKNPEDPWFFSANKWGRLNPHAYSFDEQMAEYLYGPGSINHRKGEAFDHAKDVIGAVYGADNVDNRLKMIEALVPLVQYKKENFHGTMDRD